MASGINDTFRQVGVAVGIAAWGAIFLGRGTSELERLAPAADQPRALLEAASSGNLGDALAGVPAGARETLAAAAREGFLAGMNQITLLGALLAFAGALAALWLVREHEIEREPHEAPEHVREADALPEPAAA